MNEPRLPLETASWWFDRAGFVLIAALVIGAICTAAIVWLGIEKEHHWDLARESAAKRIAELSLQSDQLRKDTADANERAAEANAKAAEAMLALEKLKSPREISDEKFGALAAKLAQYFGQEWTVTTYWDLKEPRALANRLKHILDAAGWKYTTAGSKSFIVGITTGIEVFPHPGANDPTKAAAELLVRLLNGAEIDAVLKQQNDPNNPNNMIFLTVGIKP